MVCTGNVCRSPIAEVIARAALPPIPPAPAGAGVAVRSAGVRGLEGEPMHACAAAALAELGLDGGAFRARALTAAMAAEADLLLCAAREHRSAVASAWPRSVRRCFTMREFGRLTAGLTPVEIAGGSPRDVGGRLVAAAARRRAAGDVVAAADDDVDDPLGADPAGFRACARTVADAVWPPFDLLARALRLGSPADS
jgi:protein-tyrosine phosphatase